MDTQSLKAFLAVAGQQSFSEAAEQLHLTQSAVSKRIQQLEQLLGVALFERHNRTVSLTEAGNALLPRARSILELIDDTAQQLENLGNDISGTLTLATSHHIGLHRLPPILRQFVEQYPSVHLKLEFMGSEKAYQAVRQRQVDLALTTLAPGHQGSTPDQQDIETETLWNDVMHCVCRPHHALTHKIPLTWAHLANEAAILPEPDTITFQLIEAQFNAQGVTLNAPMPTNYLETIKMMVSVGIGWSLLPESMVDEQLTRLTWPGDPITRELGIISLRQRPQSNATRALVSLLRNSTYQQ